MSPGAGDVAERRAMALALRLAADATNVARPNPGVGCVILRDGEVVGQGATQRVGGAHAEVVALAQAADRARDATVVTTLEPCNHTGRTGPCSRALVAAGVARVVYAVADPSDEANGGASHLADHGVDVQAGLFGDWAAEVHRAFLLRSRLGRPAVTLKVARTADGHMALAGRRWVTGIEARRRVHEMRSGCDAVLVGVGTILADDPRLDVRDAALSADQPRPVVVDARLDTPPGSAVVERGAILLASSTADPDRRAILQRAGAVVVEVPAPSGRIDLAAAMARLADEGIAHVLAEPGPRLGQALMEAGLVDDVILHVSPDVADGPDLPTVAPALARPLARSIRRLRLVGDDLEIHFRPVE